MGVRRAIFVGAFTLLVLPAAFLCTSTRNAAAAHGLELRIPPAISVGDLVFFRTTSWRGSLVRSLQNDTASFTHVGIVVGTSGDVTIAHACPTRPAVVRVQRLKELLTQDDVAGIAVYRARLDGTRRQNAASIAVDYARRGTPFDFQFNLLDDREIYCTELIWRAYRGGGLTLRSSSGLLFPADLLKAGLFIPLR